MLKRGLLAITSFLALLVPVRAQGVEGFEPLIQFFAAFFDKPYTPDIIILCFALFIVFTVILSVLLINTKIFEGFQPAAAMVGAIFAFITIRYTPLEFFFFLIAGIMIFSFVAFLFMIYDAFKKGVGTSIKIGGFFAAIGLFVVGFLLITAAERLGGAGVTIPVWGYTLAWLCVIAGIFILVATFMSIFMGMKFGATMTGLSKGAKKMYKSRGLKGALKVLKDLQYEAKVLAIEESQINAAINDPNRSTFRPLLELTEKESRREAGLSNDAIARLTQVKEILAKEGKTLNAVKAALSAAIALRTFERVYYAKARGVEAAFQKGKDLSKLKPWLNWLKQYIERERALVLKIIAVTEYIEQEIASISA